MARPPARRDADPRLALLTVAGLLCLVGAVVLVGSAVADLLSARRDAPPAAGQAPVTDPDPRGPAASASPSALASAPASALPSGPAPGGPTGSASPSASASAAARPLAGRVVALDPGHNRDNAATAAVRRPVDAGNGEQPCDTPETTADGFRESLFALRTARAAQRRLEALGARVVLTRPADAGAGPCFDARAAAAERADADVLLSLHADAAPADVQGFTVLRPGVVPGHTEDIAEASARLARAVSAAMVTQGLAPSSRGPAGLQLRTDVGLLNRSDIPTVVVVCGNPRDPQDVARMASGSGQELISVALADAVVDYLT